MFILASIVAGLILQSPRGADLFPAATPAAVPVQRTLTLEWDYPPLPVGVSFNVWQTRLGWRTNVAPMYEPDSMTSSDTNQWRRLGWSTNRVEIIVGSILLTNTIIKSFTGIRPTNDYALFVVTATNAYTGLESPNPFYAAQNSTGQP